MGKNKIEKTTTTTTTNQRNDPIRWGKSPVKDLGSANGTDQMKLNVMNEGKVWILDKCIYALQV